MDDQIDKLDKQIVKLEGKLKTREGKLFGKGGSQGTQAIILALKAARTSIQSLREKAATTDDEMRTRLDNLATTDDEMRTRLDNLATTDDEMRTQLDDLVGELEHAGVRRNQVEQLAHEAIGSVTRVEEMKGGVEDARDAIHADLLAAQDLLASVKGDMHHKFEQLENDLYQQITDIVARFGTKMQQEAQNLENGKPIYEQLPGTPDSSPKSSRVITPFVKRSGTLGTDMLHGRRAIALKF